MNARSPFPVAARRVLRAVVFRCYPMHKGVSGLAMHVAGVTLLAISVMLTLFLLKRPGALQAGMWGQVFLQGFPVAFLVNLAGGAFYAEHFATLLDSGRARSLMIALADLGTRAFLFIVLTAVSLMSWAMFHGAFGGDPDVALASLATTLKYGVRFDGLAGVYIYACLLCAFPFPVLALIGAVPTHR